MARLLVVDSSPEERSSMTRNLRAAGYDTVGVSDADAAVAMLTRSHFDAVITEWRLSDASALDLAARLRRSHGHNATRILVAATEVMADDVARALDGGIDDCLVKTAPREELLARVKAALRRPVTAGDALQVGPVVLDRVHHKVTVSGAEIALAPAEFRLMAHFMENRARVLSRRELLAQVWNRRKGIGERTVDVHVRRLRAALSPHGCDHLLQTVRGFGYRFG